jgi:hypothetical protein
MRIDVRACFLDRAERMKNRMQSRRSYDIEKPLVIPREKGTKITVRGLRTDKVFVYFT